MIDAGRFPRGFLYSVDAVEAPPGYVPGPLLPNFWVHPWAPIESAADGEGRFVVVIGTAVSTAAAPGAAPTAAQGLLDALTVSEELFFELLDEYSGRHAIFYGRGAHVRVLSDATAMRAIFYAVEGGIVASHAVLVEQGLGGPIVKDDLPFKYGYPGNRTPYPRTRLLTANTLYDVQEGQVRRFWPRRAPKARSVEEAANEVLERSATALRRIAQQRPVRMALTAGLDSRTLLAIVHHSGIDYETYTYGHGGDTEMDRNLAADLAASIGVRHTLVPKVRRDPEQRARLDEAHYGPHHQAAVGQLAAWLDDPSTAILTAHVLESGGRNFVKTRVVDGVPSAPPTTAAAMARMQFLTMEPSARSAIREWGRGEYFVRAEAAFQDYIGASEYDRTLGLLDPFDQLYWEHRMSAWHGTAMVERDFYGEAFIPYNSRAVLAALLGVPQPDRLTGAPLYALIKMVYPRLLDLPINPKSWPSSDE